MMNQERNEILGVISKWTRSCRRNTCREVCPWAKPGPRGLQVKGVAGSPPWLRTGCLLKQDVCVTADFEPTNITYRRLLLQFPWSQRPHSQEALLLRSLSVDYLASPLSSQSIINVAGAGTSPSELMAHQSPALSYLFIYLFRYWQI